MYGGKGDKGGKGVNAVEQLQGWWPEPAVRPLSAFQAAILTKPAVWTANRFEALREDEYTNDSEEKPRLPTLADFVQTTSLIWNPRKTAATDVGETQPPSHYRA